MKAKFALTQMRSGTRVKVKSVRSGFKVSPRTFSSSKSVARPAALSSGSDPIMISYVSKLITTTVASVEPSIEVWADDLGDFVDTRPWTTIHGEIREVDPQQALAEMWRDAEPESWYE